MEQAQGTIQSSRSVPPNCPTSDAEQEAASPSRAQSLPVTPVTPTRPLRKISSGSLSEKRKTRLSLTSVPLARDESFRVRDGSFIHGEQDGELKVYIPHTSRWPPAASDSSPHLHWSPGISHPQRSGRDSASHPPPSAPIRPRLGPTPAGPGCDSAPRLPALQVTSHGISENATYHVRHDRFGDLSLGQFDIKGVIGMPPMHMSTCMSLHKAVIYCWAICSILQQLDPCQGCTINHNHYCWLWTVPF